MTIQGPPGPQDPRLSLTDWAQQNGLAPQQTTEERWLYPGSINGGRWNKLWPYQLVVVDQQADGTYTAKRTGDANTTWTFTLPISPEALQISAPFAIETDITLGGFIEKHNGLAIRMLSMSGTTGVFFGRKEAPATPDFSTFTTAQSIFAGELPGTLAAANQLSASFNDLRNGRTFPTNAVEQSTFDDLTNSGNGKLTGYFQFRLLELFLEAYAELKRTTEGRRSRLAFVINKHEQAYLVSPINFDLQRSAARPLEYNYSLQLKSAKRVKLTPGAADIVKTYVPVQRDPGALAKLLNKVQQVRVVLQNARKTIAAVGGDVEHTIFQPLQQLTLMVKDALSVPLSVADLADSIIQDTKAAILNLKQTKSAVKNFPQNAAAAGRMVTQEAFDIDTQVNALAAEQADDPRSRSSQIAHPANDPFIRPTDNYDYFSLINVGDLQLQPAVVSKIAAARNAARRLTRLDFENQRDAIATTAAAFSNAIGMGGATYNEVFGITSSIAPAADPSDDDLEVVYALNDLVIEMNRLVVTNDNDPNPKLDAMATVAGLAQRSGIAFKIPRSKFSVPFPYGSTLEMLSARYLGSPGRWYEIAALNGLQAPYVDEEGFKLPLLVNGAENNILVADASNLYVGQPVWIESIGTTRTSRHIANIEPLAPGQFFVTVDGPSDLDSYKTMSNAFLQAFLPNTVNSQMTIFIPSNVEPKDNEDFRVKEVPGIDVFDKLLQVGGIDLLLTPKNDLVITPEGDVRWATGLTNIVQKVRIALSTVRGTLLEHPEFGLPVEVGRSLADFTADEMSRAANDLFSNDPTFEGVEGVAVNINGPVTQMGLGVRISGLQQVIPISADIAP
jgi:hypothetical protein